MVSHKQTELFAFDCQAVGPQVVLSEKEGGRQIWRYGCVCNNTERWLWVQR